MPATKIYDVIAGDHCCWELNVGKCRDTGHPPDVDGVALGTIEVRDCICTAAISTIEGVCPRSAVQAVIAGEAVDGVVAGAAAEEVVATAAQDGVVEVRTERTVDG